MQVPAQSYGTPLLMPHSLWHTDAVLAGTANLSLQVMSENHTPELAGLMTQGLVQHFPSSCLVAMPDLGAICQ